MRTWLREAWPVEAVEDGIEPPRELGGVVVPGPGQLLT
jgi:hypothetical protein